MTLVTQVQEAVAFIKEQASKLPSTTILNANIAVVLGTGLGALTQQLEVILSINYSDIPHFPEATVPSHDGQLVFGTLENVPIIVMKGRFHYYEGYTMQQLTFPIRVLKSLGVEHIIMSNAVGSIVPQLKAGQLALIRDHINLHSENPLRGKNEDSFGPRFPDMSVTYDPALRKLALEVADKLSISLIEAVYAGIQGPNLETPAESKYLNIIGGEVVGMSTIPEVLVARHMGMRVLVLSVVTNHNYPFENIPHTTLEAVVAVAQQCTPKLTAIVQEIIKKIGG